jgi:hypothetical protein
MHILLQVRIMRNFNQLFNASSMMRNASPFATAGSSFANRAATSSLFTKTVNNKITLSGILNGTQKTIGTINQVIPLYNQVKPMFQNSKILLNVAKSLKGNNKNKRFTPKNIHEYKEPIDITPEKNVEKSPIKEKTISNKPSKPFFV